MRRVLLVVNPVATRTREPIERRVVAVMEEAGCQVEVVRTNGPEHTAEAAKAGAQDSADVVAVYGGDGTIMKAVGGIIDHDVPIGLIPGGTGNVLAGNLRLPKDPVEAARIVATGSPRFIDLGEMKQGDLVQYFSVACGSGFDADVMMHTSTEAKRKYGVLAYLARAFRLVSQIRPVRYDITIDGTKHEIDAVSVVVANCGEFIPGWAQLGPNISFDDGELDILTFYAEGVLESLRVGLKLFLKKHDVDKVRQFKGREVMLEAKPDRPAQVDGDSSGFTPLEVKVLPKRLAVMMP